MDKFNSPEYKRSRKAYVSQCMVEYFVTLIVADVFLARLLSNIGISDSLVGIISSFITLAFVFQLMSIFVLRIKMSTKKIVMIFDTMSIFFFMFMYCVPFLPFGRGVKTALVTISILLAYLFKYLIFSICFKWGNSFVSPSERGTFSAVKEIISLLGGMIFTAVAGYIFDKFEACGNLNGAFIFIAITIFIINVFNFTFLAMIKKEDAVQKKDDTLPFNEVLKNTLGNKNFRSIIVLTILYQVQYILRQALSEFLNIRI